MSKWSKIKRSPQELLYRLDRYDRRRYWVKFAVALILMMIYTFLMGHDTIMDKYSVEAREEYLMDELDRIEPLFESDSIRLERIKGQGAEVEHIAREKYLMKAPGEEIYIVAPSDQDEP